MTDKDLSKAAILPAILVAGCAVKLAWQPLGFHAIWLTVVVGLATWGLLHTKPGKRIARVRVEMMSGTRWEDVWEAR